jgi:hypothetical protein
MLTISTSLNVVCDVLLQLGPPVVSLYEVGGPTDSGVSISWRVMQRLDESSFSFDSLGDYDVIPLPP